MSPIKAGLHFFTRNNTSELTKKATHRLCQRRHYMHLGTCVSFTKCVTKLGSKIYLKLICKMVVENLRSNFQFNILLYRLEVTIDLLMTKR